MKNVLIAFALISLSCIMLSCKLFQNNENRSILGHWVFVASDDGLMTLAKVDMFKVDEGGIAFLENGKLQKRQNSGRCGTPPITYATYDGEWKMNENSIVAIKSAYWGGTFEAKWRLVSASEQELKFKDLGSEYVQREE